MQRANWWTAFGVFAAVCVGFWALSTHRDRVETLESAQARLDATARLLDQHADRAFEAGDRVIRAMVEMAPIWDVRDEEGGRRALGQLQRLIEGSPQISSAWIMDVHGTTVVENWAYPPKTSGNFAHRDYFQAHVHGDPGLYIGSMQTGSVNSRPRFTLSRKITGPDGRFAGVAVAGVFSEYFSSVYGEAGLGDGARLTLAGLDGKRLAVWPPGAGGAGEVDQLSSLRQLARFPVRIAVSQPLDTILDDWRQRALGSGATLLAALLAFGGLTALGLRTARKEQAARDALMEANERLEARVEARTAELAESEGRLRLATAAARVGIWEVDLVAGRGRWSAEAVRLTDVGREGFTAEDWLEMVHPDDRAATDRAWRRAVEEGVPYDVRFRTAFAPEGAERWVHSRGMVERDAAGRPVRGAGVVMDVTAQASAEAALAASLAEMQAFYDTAPVGLCMLDPGMRYVRVNERLAEINGRTVAEHIGRTVVEIVPLVHGLVEPVFRTVLETRAPVLDIELVSQGAMQPGERRTWNTSWVPILDAEGEVSSVSVVVEETTQHKRAAEQRELLINELNHRVKNTLATVQAVAMQTFRGMQDDPWQALELFEARLLALSKAHDVLTRESWAGAGLRDVVAEAVAAHRGVRDDAFLIEGPPLRLAPKVALSLAMTLHELCTNAAKYGALSAATGKVAIRWRMEGTPGRLTLAWEESGGPPVAPPTRKGFGSRLIERQLARELGGAVWMDYAPAGVVCVVEVPLSGQDGGERAGSGAFPALEEAEP